jgi:hypothetical protein
VYGRQTRYNSSIESDTQPLKSKENIMNEITLSTQVSAGRGSRLSIKLDVKSLGVDCNEKDIIRVRSYKKDGTLILSRVGKKAAKTVAYGLTKTGGGEFAHSLGIYVAHRPTRFRNALKPATTVSAGARFIDSKKKLLQVFLPRDIFQGEVCAK